LQPELLLNKSELDIEARDEELEKEELVLAYINRAY